jgi:hypothetical protein
VSPFPVLQALTQKARHLSGCPRLGVPVHGPPATPARPPPGLGPATPQCQCQCISVRSSAVCSGKWQMAMAKGKGNKGQGTRAGHRGARGGGLGSGEREERS